MSLRKRCLPSGWYPETRKEVEAFLSGVCSKSRSASAVIAPHAGWFYSGKLAALSISALPSSAETVVIIGGHLVAGRPALFAEEDAVESPLGNLEIDKELRDLFRGELGFTQGDKYRDNTIEVLLPIVAYYFPKARILPFRLANDISSFSAGECLARVSKSLNRKISVIGSTDLTHYGVNYDFAPHGMGVGALRWVRDVNDFGFIESVKGGDPEKVLAHADQNVSACSVGAVLGALGFARFAGANNRELLAYATSADAVGAGGGTPDSFVGYAAMAFE